jgi:hypothetical protein
MVAENGTNAERGAGKDRVEKRLKLKKRKNEFLLDQG